MSRRLFRVGIASCLLLVLTSDGLPQNEETIEYPVKLAFLYNLAKFVEWPPRAFRDGNSPLVICVAGADPFGPDLEDALRARTVSGRHIEVRTGIRGELLKACHIVFVTGVGEKEAAGILASLKGSSVLTVGENDGFAAQGGLINLFIEDKRLRFEANFAAIKQSPLRVSSKLLALAKIVKPAPGS